ncbi:MAG TPA: PP2C family protein-serine/threonine phosphatase [Phycisphaerae bacterium]|nr:PP2C family protein-serine/threonine phosphatase [Phycisphaerae bacterium]HOJ75014.1 PP2C family protein-serine/threonine phosphatase [Phycisphaerae bacterium]HOM51885.1 PP2C family protein-serine/threonine phosphatase [Phycisphaerae bacterium]HOQ84933.1 PP2C family protein-serine/threonine phosphatase [Phycisphaerae bacterium]HPP28832.1 PP2C family protein-serine/threonine phosphatase [Phycisphaerae bacterium]
MAQPQTTDRPVTPPEVKMQCMEIWGGNEARDTALSVPGIDAWVHSQPQPGHRSGGDIHYVSMCGTGRITRFVVADVSGHGEQASELARFLRSLMRRYINTLDQAKFVQRLNQEFSRAADDGMFATAVLATYFAPLDHLVVVNAGHPAPLWYRVETNKWQVLCPQLPECTHRLANLPLGVIAPTSYEQFAVRLAKGDVVLIYTDSFIEARSPDGQLLGEEGLLKIVSGLDPANPLAFREALLNALDEYRGHAPPEDDMTLLLLQHNGADPPWPSLGQTLRSIGKMMRLIKV